MHIGSSIYLICICIALYWFAADGKLTGLKPGKQCSLNSVQHSFGDQFETPDSESVISVKALRNSRGSNAPAWLERERERLVNENKFKAIINF